MNGGCCGPCSTCTNGNESSSPLKFTTAWRSNWSGADKFQLIEPLGDRDPETARELFDECLDLLRDAMAEARRLISGLRPPILDEAGVVDALDYLISEQRHRAAVRKSRLSIPRNSVVLPRRWKTRSSAFVQECLTNACRYSQTEKVRIELGRTADRVQVEVRDWGIGFDPTNVGFGHYGLQGIRERAQVLGGSAVIDAAPGKGTTIRVDLPLLPLVENGAAKAVE